MDTLILLLLAVVPPIIIMVFTYHIDKIEKEPLSLLIGLFLMGILSTVPAVISESVGGIILKILPISNFGRNLINAFLIVALSEEGFKYFLMKLISWKHKAFDYRFDGIVYAVYTSLGFAAAENLLYVLKNGVSTALMRAVTAIPLHAACGIIMGIYYGFARGCTYAGNERGRKKNAVKAVWIPVVVHGFYDFCLFLQDTLFFLIWILFTVVVFIVVLVRLILHSKNDHPIVIENQVAIFGQEGLWFPQTTFQARGLNENFQNTVSSSAELNGMSNMQSQTDSHLNRHITLEQEQSLSGYQGNAFFVSDDQNP